MSELKPENRALIERNRPTDVSVKVFQYGIAEMDRLLDAARAEGPRPKPSQEAVERVRPSAAAIEKMARAWCIEHYDGGPPISGDPVEPFRKALLASFSDAPSDGGACNCGLSAVDCHPDCPHGPQALKETDHE